MKYPRNVIWYVEARPWGAPTEAPQMGSAVAVRLFRPGDAASHRKLLLTCAHVVRGKSTDQAAGYGDSLGEFLCWPPGNGYTKPEDYTGRSSGACPGSFTATISPITLLPPGDVPPDRRRPALDWVLLEVKDPGFQDMYCVYDLAEVADGDTLDIVGYPGGAVTWKAGSLVENLLAQDFAPTRQGIPGTIKLDGNGRAGPGMSGGGVFNAKGQLVGIHRSQTAVELAFGAVAADYIKSELFAAGWSVSRTPADDLEGISEVSQKVGASVSHLAVLAQDPAMSQMVRNALGPLKPVLAQLKADLAAMQACKECHEVLLHRAGFKVGPCLDAIKEWKANPDSLQLRFGSMKLVNDLMKDALRFQTIAPRCQTAYPPGPRDAKEMQDALTEVGTLIRDKSPSAEQPIRLVVQRIINTTPALLQQVLGRMAQQLPFGEIAEVVGKSALDTSAGTTLEGLMELLPLQSLTRRLVGEHYVWQDLDKELRLMDTDVEALSGGKEDALPDIAYTAKRVVKKAQELQQQENALDGVGVLLDTARQLQTLSGANNPDIMAVLNAYLYLQTQADHLFLEADQRLLAACQRLTQIIHPIEQLVAALP